jgi:hypothetical protein
MKKFFALAAVGFALSACGGPVAPEAAEAQELAQTEQAVNPTCPAGYTSQIIWECEKVCGANYGNIRRLYCSGPNGEYYDAGRYGTATCGACY